MTQEKPNYDLNSLKRFPDKVRLAQEHIALHELCEKSPKIDYEVLNTRGQCPSEYKIIYHLKSIIGVDEDQNAIFHDRHEARISLPPKYPLEPAKCAMMSDVWHPNIKFSGPHKGHICTNSNEFGLMFDLYLLIHRIGEILQYKNYHAENVYPFPDDEHVAKWVREYGEPHDIVNKGKGIFTDFTNLMTGEVEIVREPEADSMPEPTMEKPAEPLIEKKEEPTLLSKPFKFKINAQRSKPKSSSQIKINRK